MGTIIALNDTLFEVQPSFVENVCIDGCEERLIITPLLANGKTEWYEIIFQDEQTRYIQRAEWGWKFMGPFPEPDDRDPDEIEGDLLLAQDVGMVIEAHYRIK